MTALLSGDEQLIWIIPVVVFFIAVGLTPLVIRQARRMGWIATPGKDRWHVKPVALMGGVAIYLSASTLFFWHLDLIVSAFWVGASIMFFTGLLDDRMHLSPVVKLLAQLFAASLLMFGGYQLVAGLPVWISVPLTIFWIIGITNAVNLLDNMDGLSPGVTSIGLLFVGVLLFLFAEPLIALLVLSVAAATLGFLVYNFKPARVFMGDSGSLFIGYVLAGSILLLIDAAPTLEGWKAVAIAVSLTAVPIFDTTLVTLNRLFRGISPAHGGSDHLSHRLVLLGLSERWAVLFLYLLAAVFGALAVWSFYTESILFYMMGLLGLVALVIFGSYLSRLPVYARNRIVVLIRLARLPNPVKRRIQLIGVVLDLVLVVLAFTLAHYIRFESWSPQIEQAVLQVLPGVVIIKLATFFLFGLYRGIWKHAGVMELMRISGAVAVSVLFSALYCWFLLDGYLSLSVFFVDFLLLFFFIAGTRFSYKGLRRVFSHQSSGERNVLLYGAGDAGWLALSEIRNNPHLNFHPVGFVDDSPWKQGGVVQGLRVLGTGEDLQTLCREHRIHVVLVTISELSEELRESIRLRCNRAGVNCKQFTATFTTLEPESPHRKERKIPLVEFREME